MPGDDRLGLNQNECRAPIVQTCASHTHNHRSAFTKRESSRSRALKHVQLGAATRAPRNAAWRDGAKSRRVRSSDSRNGHHQRAAYPGSQLTTMLATRTEFSAGRPGPDRRTLPASQRREALQ
jgi:hypothetical protein